MSGKRGLVIDNGSQWIKAGFSKDEAPRSMVPSIVGSLKHKGVMVGTDNKASFVGAEALKKRGLLDITRPINSGEVTDWQAMEQVWHHTFFNELQVSPEEQSVLLTEPPVNSFDNRKKALELMFEIFCTPSVYIGNTAVLSLYASGRTTGCVIESGHTSTHVVPIFEGYALPHTTKKMKWGGASITRYLAGLLEEKGYSFTTEAELELVARMKETCGQTALSWTAEKARFDEKGGHKLERKFVLPDGTDVSLASEYLEVAETLFQPDLMGLPHVGVHKLVVDVIKRCNLGIKNQLFGSVVLAGGSTMFPKFETRLQQELSAVVPDSIPTNVVASAERKYAAWIGGSMLSSLSTYRNILITKDDFEEAGGNIAHRKCL